MHTYFHVLSQATSLLLIMHFLISHAVFTHTDPIIFTYIHTNDTIPLVIYIALCIYTSYHVKHHMFSYSFTHTYDIHGSHIYFMYPCSYAYTDSHIVTHSTSYIYSYFPLPISYTIAHTYTYTHSGIHILKSSYIYSYFT